MSALYHPTGPCTQRSLRDRKFEVFVLQSRAARVTMFKMPSPRDFLTARRTYPSQAAYAQRIIHSYPMCPGYLLAQSLQNSTTLDRMGFPIYCTKLTSCWYSDVVPREIMSRSITYKQTALFIEYLRASARAIKMLLKFTRRARKGRGRLCRLFIPCSDCTVYLQCWATRQNIQRSCSEMRMFTEP